MAPMGSLKRVKPSPPGTDSQPPRASSPSGRQRSTSQRNGDGVNWYPGTWPARASKAAPVTEVARESISASRNASPSISSSSTPNLESTKHLRNPSLRLTQKEGASSRSLPASATTTCINIASDGSSSTPVGDTQLESASSPTPTKTKEEPGGKEPDTVDKDTKRSDPAAPTTTPSAGADNANLENNPATTQQWGLFSWLYGPYKTEENKPTQSTPAEAPTDSATQDSTPKRNEAETGEDPAKPINTTENAENREDTPDTKDTKDTKDTDHPQVSTTSQRRSWFQMWYGSSPSSKGPEQPKKETHQDEAREEPPSATNQANDDRNNAPTTSNGDNDRPAEADVASQPPVDNGKSSGWSFWFRDTKDSAKGKEQKAQAVEASVQPEQPSSVSESVPEQKVEVTKKGSTKIKPQKETANPPVVPGQVTAALEPHPEPLPPKVSEASASRHLQSILPNQVLPHFKDTFALQETPSLLQSIGRFLHYTKEPENKHVNMIKDPPHIRKALAIGIHGYFPAPLIRSVLGQPTGTSIRFSNMAADAIRKWTEGHGYKCDIGKIALEGEGRISERIDLLWKLLLNWMEEIRKADFIMVACHSQGVPVAVMLVAKLISFGCVNAARVGICAMAGVNLGPFPDYRSRWISGSAGELFEFALPNSRVSKEYEDSLRHILNFGVRISYIGSIDDQLVSLESSLFSPIVHPYIYRAVFVDGRVHAPSFLSHLVGFALKIRNLGISDHGLIRELSAPLAGSLYSGEGHSRLYDDESVYLLAIQFALETSNVSGADLEIKRSYPPTPANPYILPFAMRGLLEEEYVRKDLYEETMELLRQFDNWKPSSKVLKDVKFRLEGIRSKL